MLRVERPARIVSMNDCLDERLHWLWKEVSLRLQVFSRRVQEGRDAEAASEFARFVRNAGLVRLIALSGAKGGAYAVDAPALDKAVSRLLDDCIAPLNGRVPQTRASAVVASYESLERKLDGLTEAVAKLSGQSVSGGNGSKVAIGGAEAERVLSPVASDDDDVSLPLAHAQSPVAIRNWLNRGTRSMIESHGLGARRKTAALKLLKK